MHFEWDEVKRKENLKKHNIDFDDVSIVFDGLTVTIEDERFDYDESRYVTFGLLQESVIAIVHTERDDRIRVISARKATKNETKIYYQQLTDGFH